MAFPDLNRPIQPANTGTEKNPPGATKTAEENRTQNPRQRGPNDPTGDPAVDRTRTIDDPAQSGRGIVDDPTPPTGRNV
jgi:hypothetical protein